MFQQNITIQNPRGIHLRPAMVILQTRSRFPETTVWLSRTGSARVAPASPLDLLGMALASGTHLLLEVCGPNEAECGKALANLLQKKYDFQ